jgi:hypothetical protein
MIPEGCLQLQMNGGICPGAAGGRFPLVPRRGPILPTCDKHAWKANWHPFIRWIRCLPDASPISSSNNLQEDAMHERTVLSQPLCVALGSFLLSPAAPAESSSLLDGVTHANPASSSVIAEPFPSVSPRIGEADSRIDGFRRHEAGEQAMKTP